MKQSKRKLAPIILSMIFIFNSIVSVFMLCPKSVNAVSVGVTSNYNQLYANGHPITLKENPNHPGYTFIFYDNDQSTPVVISQSGNDIPIDGDGAYDLSNRTLYGGSKDEPVQSTSITMLSGKVSCIYGGGDEKAVNGDTNITISGGETAYAHDNFGGGFGTGGVVNGDTYITISGSANIRGNIYGGGRGDAVTGNARISIEGGNMWNVYGGGYSKNSSLSGTYVRIVGGSCVDIIGAGRFGHINQAQVEIGIDANVRNIIAGSDAGGTCDTKSVKCEVAYYDGDTKLTDPQTEWVEMNYTPYGSRIVSANATYPTTELQSEEKLFTGWKYADGTEYHGMINASDMGKLTTSRKIYANWAYPLTYHANGATGGSVPTDNEFYASGTEVTLKSNKDNLSKTGYSFAGWSLTPNGTPVSLFTMGAQAETVYAVWNEIPKTDGTTSGIVPIDTNNYQSNASVSISGNTGKARKNTNGVGVGDIKNAVSVSEKEPYLEGLTGTVVSALKEAKSGAEIKINMNGTTIVHSEWFEAIAGKDIELVVDMGNGIKWTINGQKITGNGFKNIDLAVLAGAKVIPGSMINKIAGGRQSMQFTIAHNGEFGFIANLFIDFGKSNEGLYANLFYYNEEMKALEFVDACKINKDGFAKWKLEHASSYSVVIDKVNLKPENAKADQASNVPKTGKEVSNGGQSNHLTIPILLTVTCAALVIAGVAVVVLKKIKREKCKK